MARDDDDRPSSRSTQRRKSDRYGEGWIRRGSAEERAGRGREKDQSDELDNFERRLEWFRLYHSDRSGWTSEQQFRKAVDHAVRLEQALPPIALDPGGRAPSRRFAVASGQRSRARVRKATNPAPQSSLGFVGDSFEIVFDERELPEGVDVKVRLDRDEMDHVELSSVRVFRWDEDTEAWVLIPRSGPGRDGSYAWVRAHRPGRYTVIGLPSEPELMLALLVLAAARPQLELARRARDADALLDAIVNVVFAGGKVRTLGGELPGGFDLGEFDLRAGGLGLDDLRRQLGDLKIPERGLSEWEILDDISPPYWSWPPRGWPRPPYTWHPDVLPPPFMWPLLPGEWTSAGPSNVNGRIKCLAIHPSTENIVWAGAANGGVWKTVSGGLTWLPMMSQEQSLAIGAIAVAPSNGLIVYAATGEDTPGWAPSWPGVGVYRTDNGGSTWTLLSPINSKRCTRLLVHPTQPNTIYVAGDHGLHKSTDGGTTWTNLRTDHVCDALIDTAEPDRIYAAVHNSGVHHSTDGGVTWGLLSNGIPTGAKAEWIKLAMGLNGTNGTKFLLAKMGPDSREIYRSTDGGMHWTRIASDVQGAAYNEWTNMIAVDPNNHNLILAGGVGVSRSTNGSSFSSVGGTHSDHHAVVYSPEDSNVVYMATDGGVYRSLNGGATWALRSYQLVAAQLYSIGISQTTAFRLGSATQDQGIVRTTGSENWVDTGAGNEGGIFVVDPNNDQNVYTTPWSTGLRRSTNGGSSWKTIQDGLGTDRAPAGLSVRPGNSNQLLCVTNGQVFRSTNQGDSWLSVANPGNGNPICVAHAPSDPGVAYSATDNGRVFRSGSGASPGSWSEPYA